MEAGKLHGHPGGDAPHEEKGAKDPPHQKDSRSSTRTGSPSYLLGISEDITEEKQQEKMKIYTQALETSNRELQDFVFVASHDLQEPLRKIQAFGGFPRGIGGEPSMKRRGITWTACRCRPAHEPHRGPSQFTRITTRAKPFLTVDLSQDPCEVIWDLEIRLKETGGKVEVGMPPWRRMPPRCASFSRI